MKIDQDKTLSSHPRVQERLTPAKRAGSFSLPVSYRSSVILTSAKRCIIELLGNAVFCSATISPQYSTKPSGKSRA
jgi:hypothetical protein